ncbi:hypothetical protein F5Y04DRAFT_251963 [Hypomontagnella monticulosa]|nr:hypothetical protein F5Y04DRAFT_251963 [Hypomontagnella monticulosa]
MARKKQQTRLTLEPVGPSTRARTGAGAETGASASSLPKQSSPAKIRYSKGAAASSSQSRPSASQQLPRKSGRSRKVQSKLHNITKQTQGSKFSTRQSDASFTPKSQTSKRYVESDSDDSMPGAIDISSEEEDDEDDVPLAPQRNNRLRTGTLKRRRSAATSSDDEDDIPLVSSQAVSHARALKRQRSAIKPTRDDDESDDDDPIIPPSSSRRSRPQLVELEDSSDEGDSSARKPQPITPGRLRRPMPLRSSSPTKHSTGHRTDKQKKMELLRRRRAGEKIDKLTSSEDDPDEEQRGLYDSDPERRFQVLKEFDDEEELEELEEPESEVPAKRSPREGKAPAERSGEELADQEGGDGGDNGDDDLDDFVVEDDDALIGAPANLEIPLEFTAQYHLPLKEQFPLVVEWLVHNRINPAFERNDRTYTNAWRKLDDEVRTLASSKFTSSAWKVEFHRVLNGRPNLDDYALGDAEREEHRDLSCEACGRSGHPVSYMFRFSGHPYHKDTLADVESDSENDDTDSVDEHGMGLLSVNRQWYVGSRCAVNAQTAHSLIHWKHELKAWVEEHLEVDGWMAAQKLKERERMKARKRRQLANDIVDGWRERGIVDSLYRDFKKKLEEARNKKPDSGGGYSSRR